KKSKAAAGEVIVRWATWKERGLLLAALLVGTGVFGWILAAGGWSWNPYPDAYIFIGSVVAMYAQGLSVVVFWLVWLVVELVGLPLAVADGLVFSGAVYLSFLVMVVLGLIVWSKRSKQTHSPPDRSATAIGRDPDD